MHETRADTARAVTFALLLHAALFVLLFFGLWWTRSPEALSAAGSPITADLADASDLSASMQRALAEKPTPLPPLPEPVQEAAVPPPQPTPEKRPEEAVVTPQPAAQERVPDPSPVEQEKVDRDAISEETREREQEEKRRQEQIDLTERQHQQEAEQKYRLAQQQLDEKIKKIQKEREKATREAELAEQKLKQIADARARSAAVPAAQGSGNPPPGNEGVDAGLSARYAAALQAAILRNWTRPDTVPLGQRCKLVIRQIPGGEVIEAKVDPSCPYDEPGRRSIEAAVLKAQPLPYAGFESVFARTLNLNFQAQDR